MEFSTSETQSETQYGTTNVTIIQLELSKPSIHDNMGLVY